MRGVPPCDGAAKSIRVIEQLAAMLQRNEDTDKNDYDSTEVPVSISLKFEKPYFGASLTRPSVIKSCKFLDEGYHKFGTCGLTSCIFYEDELHHVGKRLPIWLRHHFLRGSHKTSVDSVGWAPVDDILAEEVFRADVYGQLSQLHDGTWTPQQLTR